MRTASLLTDLINCAENVCKRSFYSLAYIMQIRPFSSCVQNLALCWMLSLADSSILLIVGVFQFADLGQLANDGAII